MPKQEKMPFGVTKPEENKSFQIYEEVSAIRELIETGGIKIEKSKKDSVPEVIKLVTKPFEKMMDNIVSEKTKDEAKPINKTDEKGIDESLKESNKEQKGFLKGLAEKFTETVKSVSDSIGKIGKGIAEASFNMLLGPLQLITKPLEEMMGGKIFDKLLGVLTPKKFKGKPTKQKVLPKDPGAVLIASTLEEEAKEKKKGIWAKIGAGLLVALPFILAGLTLVGTLLSDLFGEGGAISFFKKGEIGKGIMTLLFGKDLSEKGPGGKITGILKQGAKWAAVGFMLGSVIPGVGNVLGALIGFGVGVIASTIKLGIDSGFFKKIGSAIKEKTKGLGGSKKLLKSVLIWAAILGPIATPIVGALVGLGMFYFGDKLKSFGKKAFLQVRATMRSVFRRAGYWLGDKLIKPIKEVLLNIFSSVGGFLMSGFEKTIDIGKKVIGWVKESVFLPIGNIFKRIGNKIIQFKDEKLKMVKGLFDNIFDAIKDFFGKIGDFMAVMSSLNLGKPKEMMQILKTRGERIEARGLAREMGLDDKAITAIMESKDFTKELLDKELEGQALQKLMLDVLNKIEAKSGQAPTIINTNNFGTSINEDRDWNLFNKNK